MAGEPEEVAAFPAAGQAGGAGGTRRTRRKSRKRRERETAAEQAERLAYVGTLASGLAHEIRSPLNAIRLNVQMMAEQLRDPGFPAAKREALERYLSRVEREVGFLQGTRTEFLTFARPPRVQPVPTDLPALVGEVLDLFAPECRAHGIEIVREFADEIFPVRIDQRQFAQVLTNLVLNAREAIGERGRITVSLAESAGKDALEIRVADDGGGVPPEAEGRLFEAWFSTKEHGAGLGLGIAKRIVEDHGGTLFLENRPGAGATFVVRLPKEKVLEFREE